MSIAGQVNSPISANIRRMNAAMPLKMSIGRSMHEERRFISSVSVPNTLKNVYLFLDASKSMELDFAGDQGLKKKDRLGNGLLLHGLP